MIGPRARWLVALVAAAALAASTLAAAALAWPSEPATSRAAGSTWSTAPQGWSGLRALLADEGRGTTRFEGPVAELSELPALASPAGAVVVLAHPAPSLSDEDQERLLALVERGGTLVLATAAPLAMLEARDIELTAHPLAGPAWPALPSPMTRAGGPLLGDSGVVARPVSGLAALYASEVGIRVGAMAAGEGQVILLTDTGLLSNQALERPQTRRLARSMFPPGAEVIFLERYHGFSRRRGLGVWLWRRGWGPWLLSALVIIGLAGWRRAATLSPLPAPRPLPPAGLTGLALAAGRLGAAGGDHRRPLSSAVDTARARGLRHHPALADAERALRARRLDGERALALSCALEDAVRGSAGTAEAP